MVETAKIMAFKLSPSALNLMEECPRCFWLNKHKVWTRPSGAFPSLPSGMDGILKHHFDKFRDKGTLPPELCSHSHCDGLLLFNEPDLMKIWRNNLKGIQHKDKEGNILFGAVDNILIKGKKLVVLDYKTRGYALKEDTADHYQNQLDIYNFLLRKNGYDTEDYALLLFYVPKHVQETGEVIFDTHLVRRKVNVKNAEEIFEKALKLLSGECPSKCCEWCQGR
jgi:hypothetical protein